MKNITEAQYDQLCDACDALLQNNAYSFESNANAFLHVIREHPIFLNAYSAVFNKNTISFCFHLLKLLLWNIIIGSYKLLHSIYRYYLLGDKLIKDKRVFKDVFISHFLNDSFINHEKDFYFFDLPQKIAITNKSSLQLYINFTGQSSSKIKVKWEDRDTVSMLLPRYLPLIQEIKIRGLMLFEAIKLLQSKTTSSFERRIKFQAVIASFSSATHTNYRIAFLARHYIKNNGIKRIFTTYEGHPWERLIFAMAREIDPTIVGVGYQHAIVFRKQHAIRRKLTSNFEPNYILCSGEHGKQQFEAINYLPSKRLLSFGSNRTIDFKQDQLAVEAKERKVFLMLSEGDLIECLPLSRFVVQLAKENLSAHFIIRFHPITRVKSVLKALPSLNPPPKNIELSSLSFEEDLRRAHFAIYRGSTTIIKAIQYGLIPLYYERPNEISIDPLYEIQKEKVNLKSIEDIELLKQIPHKELIKRQHKLIKYASRFFSPLNYDEALKINKTV